MAINKQVFIPSKKPALALGFSILSLFTWGLLLIGLPLAVVSLVLGIVSIKYAKGRAITAIILSFVGLIMSLLALGLGSYIGIAIGPNSITCYGTGINYMSVSPDDDLIAFSYCKRGKNYIYTVQSSGGKAKLLLDPKKYGFNDLPTFAPDGKFVYVVNRQELYKSFFRKVDLKGNVSEIEYSDASNPLVYVADLSLSPDNNKIYFVGSAYYGSFSPIAKSSPHKNDYYSFDLKTGILDKLTNIDAYSIAGISYFENTDSLISRQYFLSLSDNSISEINFKTLPDILPEDNSLCCTTVFPIEVAPDGSSVALTAYQAKQGGYDLKGALYLADPDDFTVKKIVLSASNKEFFDRPRFLHKTNDILVMKVDGDNREIWKSSLDGKNSQKIEIEVPN